MKQGCSVEIDIFVQVGLANNFEIVFFLFFFLDKKEPKNLEQTIPRLVASQLSRLVKALSKKFAIEILLIKYSGERVDGTLMSNFDQDE